MCQVGPKRSLSTCGKVKKHIPSLPVKKKAMRGAVTVQQHTRVLRDTSLWCLVPVCFHYAVDLYPRRWLALLGVLVAFASWMHWSKYAPRSLRHDCDVICACLYLFCEFMTKTVVTPTDIALRVLSMAFFVRACYRKVGCNIGLAAHLAFRYTAWLAVMHLYMSKAMLVLMSLFYLCTIVVLISCFQQKRKLAV